MRYRNQILGRVKGGDFVQGFGNYVLRVNLVLLFHRNLLIHGQFSEILFLVFITLFRSRRLGFLCCLKSWCFGSGNFLFFVSIVIFCNWCRKKIAQKIHFGCDFLEFRLKIRDFLRSL